MKKAHISFILDQSGSMDTVKKSTISGFNEYLSTLQKDKEVEYTFDLTTFDNTSTRKASNKSLKALEPLTEKSYTPNGGTALYDAVCDTIAGHEGNGDKWIICILTDGEENASQRWNDRDFTAMVKALNAAGNVTVTFLAANQDAWSKAQKWGIHHGNAANFVATDIGTRGAFVGMAQATMNTAGGGGGSSKNFFNKDATGNIKWDEPKGL